LRIVLDIALFLIVPLLVGMAVGAVLKERQATFTKIMIRLSLFTLALIIVGSVGAGRVNLLRYGWLGPAAVILFCVGLLQIGRIAARGTGLAEGDCLTIIIEVTIKNGLLALLLLTSMFSHDALRSQDAETMAVIVAVRDGCTYTVLLFGGVSLILGTILVIQRRRSIIGGAG
jgi:BASS family bile acid:Na+ symporter